MMDAWPRRLIRFEEGERRFQCRVAGLAVDGARVLLHHAAFEDFWTFPGGRAELGEPLAEGLRREMREELETEVTVERLLWVVENFFTYDGKAYHELGFYFLMTLPPGSSLLSAAATGRDVAVNAPVWIVGTAVSGQARTLAASAVVVLPVPPAGPSRSAPLPDRRPQP